MVSSRFKEKAFRVRLYAGMLLCSLFAISPFLLILMAMFFSSTFGCVVKESGVHPCVVLGIDFGEVFAIASVGPFLIWFTIPGGMIAGTLFFLLMLTLRWALKTKEEF